MIETGILFNGIHSFYDLNLILSAVEIAPAVPKTVYVDIPGADGALDLTEAHGEVKYSDRTHKFTFTMNPAGDLSEAAWEEKKTEVSNALNGLACHVTLDKDPDYYWLGRCSVDSYKSNKRLRQIVVSARVRPYKFKQNETVKTYNLTEAERTVSVQNSRRSVCPVITCTNYNTVIVFNGNIFNFSAGRHQDLDIRFTEGINQVTISGTGQVTFTYQEGDL
jgi:hypothetical protein